ncbi:hypothetical protein WNY51_11160 [Pseudocolwellia sp. AS88]|uniref:hypothetical protein n=1 Tax=Pseudocolwellia sp. AS88 TaxID=3063958 RepID=UPI0026EB9F9E|nr:hypothetical protein [Pseudocolwellia sp. AS88]MDO7084106.1 hypothetical protein [Pseudocolwellia sp. AS88]
MPHRKSKLKVFLTIDTEVWEFYQDIHENISSGLWGITKQGEYGLNFQLEIFRKYNLKASFFVEPLFSHQGGGKALEKAINKIAVENQEIGLHIHTEWLKGARNLPFTLESLHRNIGDFDLSNQLKLIGHAKNMIEKYSESDICCFRAGNYGADNNTLKALHELGISFDTSYNKPYLNNPCNIIIEGTLASPKLVNKTFEVPVTYFEDYPNHNRHLQLTACSFLEIRDILLSNWKAKSFSCVIVLHSFEWIKRNKRTGKHSLDKVCLKRFLKLCRYLSENTDKFETLHFKDLIKSEVLALKKSTFIAKPKPSSTLIRLIEQILRK